VGLEGQYDFELHFILQEENAPIGEHIVRARGSASGGGRSVNAEVDLLPGRYKVLPKILAWRNKAKATVEDVVKKAAEKKPQKLRQIGLNYDLAHAKAFYEDWEDMDETEPGEEDPPAEANEEDTYPPNGDLGPRNTNPKPRPWNAVCAIGLRVYSKDPTVTIKLVKPEDVEEGAALALDGVIPAGATM
jgi:hypothetical protein